MKQFIDRYHYILYMGLSYIALDYYIQNINQGKNDILVADSSPLFFTLAWILFFIAIHLLLKGKVKKIIYLCITIFFQIICLVNAIYYGIFHMFFSFKTIGLASEAKEYFSVIFDYISLPLIISLIVSILLFVLAIRFMPKDRCKTDIILATFFLVMSITFNGLARNDLGAPAPTNAWNTWAYKRNVYNSYSDTKKSLEVSGFYEYIIRDIYLSKIDNLFSNKEDEIEYLDDYFKKDNNKDYYDDLRGIFKDKNVIIVLMESIDNWLVTEDTMPTVSKLMNEGINFSNHFSPVYGGGATFNSEFMINTGYMTPLNGENASNKYGNNYFPYSLPNLFKEKNYMVNFFHENKKAYYNRGQMSKAFGYDNYYSSVEMGLPYKEIVKDTHFITNDKIREMLIPDDAKFMDFIITYSAHTPYLTKRSQCKVTINVDEKKKIESGEDEEAICIRAQARETDKFFKGLIETLNEKNKLDDTVIVGVTDHYAYGYTDKDVIYALKETNDPNLISKVPFFIWSNNIESQEIDKVNSNIDILPTIAYLFDLNYNPNYFLGNNIFDPNYNGYVFFNDYSWYDGYTYYKNDPLYDADDSIKETTRQINEAIKINELVLEANYFKNKKN